MLLRIGFLVLFFLAGCSSQQQGRRISLPECYGDNALAFVVDKSGSVKEKRIVESEKSALAAIIPKLKPEANLSIIAFDNAPLVMVSALEMNRAGKEEALKRLIFLHPNGQTHPLPALDHARRILKRSNKSCRALIVMSDAKFSQLYEEDVFSSFFSDREIQRLAVIALGNDGDLQSMRNLARAGSGDFYQVSDLSKTGKVLTDILRAWKLLE